MNKNIFLLLLCSFLNFLVASQENNSINSSPAKKATILFLSNLFEKDFTHIKNSFCELSPHAAKYRTIMCSGDARPIIMMATCLSKDIQIEVATQLLDNDRQSGNIFCSLSLQKALNKYLEAKRQALYCKNNMSYGFDLPIGFHFRTSHETCTLLSKGIKSAHTKSPLTNEEIKKIYLLLKNDPWIAETIGLKSKFLYQPIKLREKFEISIESMTQVPWSMIYRRSLLFFGMINTAWAGATPFLALIGLVAHLNGHGEQFLKETRNFWNEILKAVIKPSAQLTTTTVTAYSLYCFILNYYHNKYVLLERKKIYI